MATLQVQVEASVPYEVKVIDQETHVFLARLQRFEMVTDYNFKIDAHAFNELSVDFPEYLLNCCKVNHFGGSKNEWHVVLKQEDCDNKMGLIHKMFHAGASLREDVFKEGRLHDYIRGLMKAYRNLPADNEMKREVIIRAEPGSHVSKFLDGRAYIVSKDIKIAMDSKINEKRLDAMTVIWDGDVAKQRFVKIGNRDFSCFNKMHQLVKKYQRTNVGSFYALLGNTTVVMNRRRLPLHNKVAPVIVLGPACSGKFYI
jgi:hypothetical protein